MKYTGPLHGPLSLCARCGNTFLNITAFDKHQEVNYSRTPAVRCIDPVDISLVQDQSGLRGTPEGHARRARRAASIKLLNAKRAATLGAKAK